MNADLTPESDLPSQPPATPVAPLPDVVWVRPPARKKFQHRYRRHLLFFLLTLVTASFTDAFVYLWFEPNAWANPLAPFTLETFRHGLWYSLPMLTILSAHEFGHYFACRYHNVDATLPYFLPAPMPLTGTLGAVIRIRESFPSKRALFDIGVAGPIAGFVALLPFLVWALQRATLVSADRNGLYFGEPLLFKLAVWLHFGLVPGTQEVSIDGVGFAAWWGMLATALNLLPFGQLDGGHITYASLGRRATWISASTLATVVLSTILSLNWLLMAVMMSVMAFVFGLRHPPVPDEGEPLDPVRRMVAITALVIFVLCFTPVPIALK